MKALLRAVYLAMLLGCGRSPAPGDLPAVDRASVVEAPDTGVTTRFEVLSSDGDAGRRKVGAIALSSTYLIAIVWTAPDRAGDVRRAVDSLNRKSTLFVDAVPPRGAPRFAHSSRIVPRESPEFLAALQQDLRDYYGFELRPLVKEF